MKKAHVSTFAAFGLLVVLTAVHLAHKAPVAVVKSTPASTATASPSVTPKASATPTPTATPVHANVAPVKR